MNRLLQGDVGSGKTVVALAAMLLACEAGLQCAIMAPTQILAEQHYLGFTKWLEPLGIRVGLRTANRKEDSFLPLMTGSDEPQILVGTHALLFDEDSFSNLGLIVIDEQHKFGVLQRSLLIEKGRHPDVLVMTATPIPRTLTMTLYGDLDVSLLDEAPSGRGKIITGIRTLNKTEEASSFLEDQVNAGRQAYLVYPLVEDSETLDLKSATAAFDQWQERLPDLTWGLLHGRLKPEDKDTVMAGFREGKTNALVATTVIEVGVDVPNANLMIVFNAERFGLAQLHQLRGRIGRGSHKSYCILMIPEKNKEAADKLAILEKSRNGFDIAEADLRLRGPGDLLGSAQSGLPELKIGDLLEDIDLIEQARTLARERLEEDPTLKSPEHQDLRKAIETHSGLRLQNS